jgi:hypothetical protein
MNYYDRNGEQMTVEQWATAFEDTKYRILGSYFVGNLWVSTIWLGIDHDYLNMFRDPPMPPLIFESMIFTVPEGDDHWSYLEMRRYRTEREAMVGHTDLVHLANTMVDVEEEVMTGDPHDSDRDVHLLPEVEGGEAE